MHKSSLGSELRNDLDFRQNELFNHAMPANRIKHSHSRQVHLGSLPIRWDKNHGLRRQLKQDLPSAFLQSHLFLQFVYAQYAHQSSGSRVPHILSRGQKLRAVYNSLYQFNQHLCVGLLDYNWLEHLAHRIQEVWIWSHHQWFGTGRAASSRWGYLCQHSAEEVEHCCDSGARVQEDRWDFVVHRWSVWLRGGSTSFYEGIHGIFLRTRRQLAPLSRWTKLINS